MTWWPFRKRPEPMPVEPVARAADFIGKAKRLARAVPTFTEGPMPNGYAADVFDEITVTLLIDGKGRVFQVAGGSIQGATIHQVAQPRAEIAKLLDAMGVEDFDLEVWKELHNGD